MTRAIKFQVITVAHLASYVQIWGLRKLLVRMIIRIAIVDFAEIIFNSKRHWWFYSPKLPHCRVSPADAIGAHNRPNLERSTDCRWGLFLWRSNDDFT